ncbi:uncharacterized protein LOC121917305 [Sceloporus undulatus]|uniref:uncharacterized protein LOC121917305 n=1 Tax=Sceloporus undulatus TaxID=8520 RepID=UPI001C4AD5BE|nr:uncharacterized protein LOC121917305 [Sceloporus undulatus]
MVLVREAGAALNPRERPKGRAGEGAVCRSSSSSSGRGLLPPDLSATTHPRAKGPRRPKRGGPALPPSSCVQREPVSRQPQLQPRRQPPLVSSTASRSEAAFSQPAKPVLLGASYLCPRSVQRPSGRKSPAGKTGSLLVLLLQALLLAAPRSASSRAEGTKQQHLLPNASPLRVRERERDKYVRLPVQTDRDGKDSGRMRVRVGRERRLGAVCLHGVAHARQEEAQ